MKKKIEVGQLFWTDEPAIATDFDFECDRVQPWQGQVVKVIGESIWLRNVNAPEMENDPAGLFTAIVNRDGLYEKKEDVPCESQT
jgi:hypothetical protein